MVAGNHTEYSGINQPQKTYPSVSVSLMRRSAKKPSLAPPTRFPATRTNAKPLAAGLAVDTDIQAFRRHPPILSFNFLKKCFRLASFGSVFALVSKWPAHSPRQIHSPGNATARAADAIHYQARPRLLYSVPHWGVAASRHVRTAVIGCVARVVRGGACQQTWPVRPWQPQPLAWRDR